MGYSVRWTSPPGRAPEAAPRRAPTTRLLTTPSLPTGGRPAALRAVVADLPSVPAQMAPAGRADPVVAEVAQALRGARARTGMSEQQVVAVLAEQGFRITVTRLRGWEHTGVIRVDAASPSPTPTASRSTRSPGAAPIARGTTPTRCPTCAPAPERALSAARGRAWPSSRPGRGFFTFMVASERALDERAVARQHAAREVDVVLEAHAHVAAGQSGHRDERQLETADRERREDRPDGSWSTIAMSVGMSLGAPSGIPVPSWIMTGSSITPSPISSLTITRCPVSNTSSSGRTPSAWTLRAIARSIAGVFVMT